MSEAIKTSCPICNKPHTWQADNPSKPFCSPRCKLIDLGEWASETRRIAGAPIPHGHTMRPHEQDDFTD